MRSKRFFATMACIVALLGVAATNSALAQPCSCTSATLMGTPANIKYSAFPNGTDWNGTVGSGIEIPASMWVPTSWNTGVPPGRFNVDIQSTKLRVDFASDASYGQGAPGAQFTFKLNPLAPPPCGPAKVVSSVVTTNKGDATAYVTSNSSFNSALNTVTIAFGNIGSQPYSDWRKNDWIEAQLKFDCVNSVSMPLHGVTAVTPGPVNACIPYQLCFDVNVPNTQAVFGQAALSLQLTQNGFPVGLPITATVTQDGIKCFQLPALPAGTGYDYVLTTTFTYPGVPSQTTTTQSPIQGMNNDLVCSSGTPASTCCPPLEGKEMTGSLFWHSGVASSTYTMNAVTTQTTPAWNTLATATNAYLNYLKLICPTVATIRTKFTASTASQMGPNGVPQIMQGAPFTVTYVGFGTPSVGSFGATFNDNVDYIITADTQAYNSQGQVVQCGFDAASCNKLDRFTFRFGFQGIMVQPSGSGSKPAAPVPGQTRALTVNG